jgi:hypothetical protein
MEGCRGCESDVSSAGWTHAMTNLLLFLILVVQSVSIFLQLKQVELNDLSKEDEAVKQSLGEIKAAKKRIPSDKKPTKGE